MQTSFSLAQLADPQIAESEKILRACVHCGLCTATCPTYLLLGDEADSPRGRIYLIKDMLENGTPATQQTVTHIDRCLSCLSCMTTCPSGVHYMHLIDHARAHIEATHRRPLADRLTRAALARVLTRPRLFRLALALAPLGKALAPLLQRIPGAGPRLAAMLALAPVSAPVRTLQPARGPGEGEQPGKRARVIVMQGCAQSVLRPSIDAATRFVLAACNVDAVAAPGEGCCGALTQHMGRTGDALASARRNIDAWSAAMEREEIDAILITASGCGTTVKDYAHMLRDDPAYAEKAARVAARVRDVSEYLAGLDAPPARAPRKLRLAYQSACSLQHGQQIRDAPKRLLQQAGFTVHDIPESHICCGSAGVYNILQPEIATRLRARKLACIDRAAPDAIATGNIGCLTHLAAGGGPPVAHTVEWLAFAHGGPEPPGCEQAGISA